MRLRKLLIGFLTVILSSCTFTNEKEDKKSSEKPVTIENGMALDTVAALEPQWYYIAKGKGWRLSISEEYIVLTSDQDSTVFIGPHTTPLRAMDANVKEYRLETESGSLRAVLQQTRDSSSFPALYSTEILYISSDTKETLKSEGVGRYYLPAALNDIWVADSLNGESLITQIEISNLPRLEMNRANNTFMVSVPCGTLRGSVFTENEVLRFTDFSKDTLSCESTALPKKWEETFKSITGFERLPGRLRLTVPDGRFISLKKTD